MLCWFAESPDVDVEYKRVKVYIGVDYEVNYGFGCLRFVLVVVSRERAKGPWRERKEFQISLWLLTGENFGMSQCSRRWIAFYRSAYVCVSCCNNYFSSCQPLVKSVNSSVEGELSVYTIRIKAPFTFLIISTTNWVNGKSILDVPAFPWGLQKHVYWSTFLRHNRAWVTRILGEIFFLGE